MYLLEHDAKELLAAHGVPVPAGVLIEDANAASATALPCGPWVVKGQMSAGGRGKAGLIRKAATPAEALTQAAAVLGATVSGWRVGAVRVEEAVNGAQECYFGLLLDPATGGVRVILSACGGMDIEQVPREHIHSELTQSHVQSLMGSVRRLTRNLPLEVAAAAQEAGERLAHAFLDLEAVLIEINPLFVRADGTWVAGDAKMVTDDNALPRQPALRALLERRARAYPEAAFKLEHGFDYVVVDERGEIGLLTTGAGLSMMLIDELREAGLKPFNFLDIRTGGMRGETGRLVQVLERIAQGRNVRVLLVNIFAGITDLGEFARLLIAALAQVPQLKVPVVARLVGNGLPAARATLDAAGIKLYTDLDEALAAVRARLGETQPLTAEDAEDAEERGGMGNRK